MATLPTIDLNPEMLAAAAESRAWPFEEAKKIVDRYKKTRLSGDRAVRDRLRPVRPAAYRHVRRGRPHDHGAARLPRADRRQGQDTAALLLRRHGRLAQGAGQRAQQGDAARLSRQAADARARPVLQRISVVRRGQQCAAARLPRPLRLRLRIRLLDRLLYVGPLRRDAAEDARALRRGDGDHAAVAARGAVADLFAVPADPSRRPASSCRCRSTSARSRPARSSGAIPTRRTLRDAGDRRPRQAAMEAGLGDALGGALASTTKCPART